MVMRVFPVVGITAPRLPLEKLYTFLISPSLLWVGLSHRNDSYLVTPRRMNNNHQRPEHVHADRDETLLAFRRFVLDGNGERVVQHPISLGQGNAVLLEIRGIFLRIEIRSHWNSICTLCIYVNRFSQQHADFLLRANAPRSGAEELSGILHRIPAVYPVEVRRGFKQQVQQDSPLAPALSSTLIV